MITCGTLSRCEKPCSGSAYLSPVGPLRPGGALLLVALLHRGRLSGALQSTGPAGQDTFPELGASAAAAGLAALGPLGPGRPVRAGVRATGPLLAVLADTAESTAPASGEGPDSSNVYVQSYNGT